MSIIKNSGVEWFRQRVVGANLQHEGKVLRVMDARGNTITLEDITSGELIKKPADFIKGFADFEYPRLGYRRCAGKRTAAWISKVNSWQRGLRPRVLRTELTPALRALGADNLFRRSDTDLMMSVFLPKYDDLDFVTQVMQGKQVTAVISSDVIVEPHPVLDKYVIYFRRCIAGTISPTGDIKWTNVWYKNLLGPYFKEL